MTTEEKAKAYDEALEKAKELLDSPRTCFDIEQLKDIFSELAESEDERIRKELKEAFEAYDIESTWNGIPIRSIFAWLEKRKEQKPGEIPPYVTGIKGEPDPPGISDLEQAAKEWGSK